MSIWGIITQISDSNDRDGNGSATADYDGGDGNDSNSSREDDGAGSGGDGGGGDGDGNNRNANGSGENDGIGSCGGGGDDDCDGVDYILDVILVCCRRKLSRSTTRRWRRTRRLLKRGQPRNGQRGWCVWNPHIKFYPSSFYKYCKS